MDIRKIIRGKITVLHRVLQDILPSGNEALLNGLLMLQQAGQQNGAKIFLHFDRLVYKQHVFVVRQMQFPARLLVFVAHIVQFASTAAGYKIQNKCLLVNSIADLRGNEPMGLTFDIVLLKSGPQQFVVVQMFLIFALLSRNIVGNLILRMQRKNENCMLLEIKITIRLQMNDSFKLIGLSEPSLMPFSCVV